MAQERQFQTKPYLHTLSHGARRPRKYTYLPNPSWPTDTIAGRRTRPSAALTDLNHLVGTVEVFGGKTGQGLGFMRS